MANTDERPAVWTGHISIAGRDLGASSDFYEAIGMRSVHRDDNIAIFELRGGTHLVVFPDSDAKPGAASWDLMVEDVAATHDAWKTKGLQVSDIEHGSIHDSFTVTDPTGNSINVNNSHVIGPV
ncbi:MAG TPA: VOC family protein [Acidimicrobiia bacterium]|jgi:catechol 2,3-dioxygenase-like lactoylglutathione lyase family enzyme